MQTHYSVKIGIVFPDRGPKASTMVFNGAKAIRRSVNDYEVAMDENLVLLYHWFYRNLVEKCSVLKVAVALIQIFVFEWWTKTVKCKKAE